MACAGNDIVLPAIVKRKYTVGEELARGKFGVVFKCTSVATKEPTAVKVMLKKGNKKADVEREVDILRKLKHPSILSITDFMECDKEFVLVTELLNGGELFDYVVEKDFLEESEAAHYMTQILEGLAFCHKLKIVHLDLKPENIVLKEKDAKQLKIIDFGTAQDLNINPNAKAMVGTPEFIAPEVLNYEPVTCAADMWAIGIITYILLTGMSPFLGDDDMETINNISSGEYEYPDPEDEDTEAGYEDISKLAKEFIDNFLVMKPELRGTAQSSLKHPWIVETGKGAHSARISTVRLKQFRAKRKWKAVGKALKFMTRLRAASLTSMSSNGSDVCALSPTDILPPTTELDECTALGNAVRALGYLMAGSFVCKKSRVGLQCSAPV